MLSTADLLACHHDAKLSGASGRRERPAVSGVAVERRAASFRPGLRVTVEPGAHGGGRAATLCWDDDGTAVIAEHDR